MICRSTVVNPVRLAVLLRGDFLSPTQPEADFRARRTNNEPKGEETMETQTHKQIQRGEARLNRRELIKLFGVGAAAMMLPSVALRAGTAHAQAAGSPTDLITRRIPKTNEVVPAIGLGTFLTFDIVPGQQRGHLHEVV